MAYTVCRAAAVGTLQNGNLLAANLYEESDLQTNIMRRSLVIQDVAIPIMAADGTYNFFTQAKNGEIIEASDLQAGLTLQIHRAFDDDECVAVTLDGSVEACGCDTAAAVHTFGS